MSLPEPFVHFSAVVILLISATLSKPTRGSARALDPFRENPRGLGKEGGKRAVFQ